LTPDERAVYRRYAPLALPRHTSYPIAPVWRDDYGPGDFRADLADAVDDGRPFALYVHVPFCEKLCYYCACTKEIVPAARRRVFDPARALLAGLEIEAEHFAARLDGAEVRQVHLGGGTPTFLTPEQLARLWHALASRFTIAADAEIAIEIDPRVTTHAHLDTLRGLGFNRVSLGIQDFALAVQKAVNRVQPFETVREVVGWCRERGFASVNFDLIYGLPFQTLDSMSETLDRVLALGPDRIAFYRLAVIPEIFRWQNVFKPHDLPGGDLPLELNLLAIRRFLAAGYEFIGLDHFARPHEGLAQARRTGELQRNFQGMTTGKTCALLGLGPSAISQLDGAFAQNRKTSGEWLEAVGHDFATERGLRLSADDRLRRELLQQLYAHGRVEKDALERAFGIDFDDYFTDELHRLDALAEQGLVSVNPQAVELTAPLGRLLVRVVAAVFDRYLPADAFEHGLAAHQSSKVG
jgi:oxygen-independent coproporphyrinogen-3 oxidase